jgi:5-(carboxyamino)imidazole ribonucleotide mutase
MRSTMKKVAVIMGSDSDFPFVNPAMEMLKQLGIPFETHVYSAHRAPQVVADFARGAYDAGFGVVIAAAGKAAHLAGVIAGGTILPVIGIPLSASLGGLDALLATVQMPSGVPVATVAVDGAANAAILAAQILAVENQSLAHKLVEMKQEQLQSVLRNDAAIQAAVQVQ